MGRDINRHLANASRLTIELPGGVPDGPEDHRSGPQLGGAWCELAAPQWSAATLLEPPLGASPGQGRGLAGAGPAVLGGGAPTVACTENSEMTKLSVHGGTRGQWPEEGSVPSPEPGVELVGEVPLAPRGSKTGRERSGEGRERNVLSPEARRRQQAGPRESSREGLAQPPVHRGHTPVLRGGRTVARRPRCAKEKTQIAKR